MDDSMHSRSGSSRSYYSISMSSMRDDEPLNPSLDMRALFYILLKNKIPGPRLVRLTSEFTNRLGQGGEGIVYVASALYERSAEEMMAHKDPRVVHSLQVWKKCVVKRLRSDDSRSYADQVRIAYSEIRRLCDESLRHHPNIVKLLGWGIFLDSLEDRSKTMSLMPLLILERATLDLDQYIKSDCYEKASFDDLCAIARDVGSGLGAVHKAGIAHGDMKPANVLMFRVLHRRNNEGFVWVAKLCDFGSAAAEFGRKSVPFQKRGTRNFWPPEYWIAENSIGANGPASLRACDIFAYGLIIWNLFAGMPFSPLGVDESRDYALTRFGTQAYYHRASTCIRGLYEVENYQTILVLFDEFASLHIPKKGAIHQRYERQKHHRKRRSRRHAKERRGLELEINRILIVLRASLNDDPSARDTRPWRYLNTRYYPSISVVTDPVQVQPLAYQQQMAGNAEAPPVELPTTAILITLVRSLLYRAFAPVATRLVDTTRQLDIWTHRLWSNLTLQFPVLKPRSTRWRTLEIMHNDVRADFPSNWQWENLSTLEHTADEACYQLAAFGNTIRAFRSSYRDVSWASLYADRASADMIYCIARIRSRVKQCCWTKASLDIHFTIEWLSGVSGLWPNFDLATLAWLCRGEVGRYDFHIGIASLPWPCAPQLAFRYYFTNEWQEERWEKDKPQAEEMLTYELLLLLEQGLKLQLIRDYGDR